MVERKLFKTKLCILYQRGHCPRQSCSFAHGDAELRRFSGSGSFSGRRDYLGSDLRDKLVRRHSPRRRNSPRSDTKGRQAHHGYSPSESPERRSDRRSKKKQHLDGQSDASGSHRISGGSDGVKERKLMSSSAKSILEEQLKQAQLDIDMLEDRKSQREVLLEEKAQEADSLISRNEELEVQLSKERGDCKRIASKIKKFVKAHVRYSKAQDELKRSRARLQKLDDELAFDVSRTNENEEDSSVNIVSDGELNVDYGTDALPNQASPTKKKPRTNLGVHEIKTGNMNSVGVTIREKLPQVAALATQSEDHCKEADRVTKTVLRSNNHRPIANENGNKWRKNDFPSNASVEKVKILGSGQALPPTSMAAHAVDESIEMEEKIEAVGAATNLSEEGTSGDKIRMPYLPPPPPLPPRHAYQKYEGVDANVDVEDSDLDMPVGDSNGEVDIEQL